ncbi:MAG: AAA-like domain-containing protein [Cyanobacteria bacterium SBLK]|nr:AAA-like domain-containing protein [Cyanobacteria bacterium SBLK]
MNWEKVRQCTVAIKNSEESIYGTGFFISSNGYLLTCAHVVEEAGGWDKVRVNGQPVRLVYSGESDRDDFTILQVPDYQGECVPLSLTFEPMTRFLSIGYGRDDFPKGASIEGQITDQNIHADFGDRPMLRLRIEADAQMVQGGYSGSPVFDAERGVVVGAIAASDRQEGALAIPLATIQERWPILEQFLNLHIPIFPTAISECQRIFISYCSKEPDISLAQTFYEEFNKAGHQSFMAGVNIHLGEDWAKRIDQELEKCDYFVLLLSSQAALSETVTEEVRRAKELQNQHSKPIILPIFVQFSSDVSLNYDLRSYLSRIQRRVLDSEEDTPKILQEILVLLSDKKMAQLTTEETIETPIIETPDTHPLPIAEPELRQPTGAIPLASKLYIERQPIEQDCYEEILQPGALIRIKAPRQMGKTSLMARILNYAREQGYQAIPISLQLAESQTLESLEDFLYWLCKQVGRKLNKLDRLEEYWSSGTSKEKCSYYLEECLLEESLTPIVLGLDEVDRVFKRTRIVDDFFALLRYWYEAARYGDASSSRWQKLRLVIVHSTEIYAPLNIDQSPFNVGIRVELVEFNKPQIQNLVRCYGLDKLQYKIEPLIELLGGHPYLIQKALYHLRRQDITVEDLQRQSQKITGIYSDHLRRNLLVLQKHPDMYKAFHKILQSNTFVEFHENAEINFQLDSMGLIKLQGNKAKLRCDLYRLYFHDRLGG